MPQIINTNIASLTAQRNLNSSQNALQTSLQRLSSGLRINSAKDDAAGLAISERFNTQIRGLNQAVRNANDGISLSQTAEGALVEVTNNLQRIRELGVQARNATNTSADRAALDAEVQQRLAEIDRVARQTEFNGLKLLDGSFVDQVFQVGANVGQTITVSGIANATTLQLGKIAEGTGTNTAAGNAGEVSGAAIAGGGDLTITIGTNTAVNIAASADYADSSGNGGDSTSAYAKAAAINASGVEGLSATANNVSETFTTAAFAGAGAGDTYTLELNGTTVINGGDLTSLSAQNVVDAINSYTGTTFVSASLSGSDITLTSSQGRNLEIDETIVDADTSITAGTFFGATAGSLTNTDTTRGTITLSASENIAVAGSTGGALIGFNASETVTLGSNGLSSRDVTTATNADTMIKAVDAALSTINSARADLGAIQNRFESTIANLSTTSENLSASRSRIVDADFAAETAALTRAQILQQAGVSVLAQANAVPQNVLALLQ
ncbi:MAG: flagellin [Pseudomonadota bacterium]|nr:flagellin [Pseudomonadota bacterium]